MGRTIYFSISNLHKDNCLYEREDNVWTESYYESRAFAFSYLIPSMNKLDRKVIFNVLGSLNFLKSSISWRNIFQPIAMG